MTGATIEGIDEIMRNLERLTPQIKEKVGSTLEKGGLKIEGRAKELVRVKTGFLRGSITTVVIDWDCVLIGTACDYAIHQEYGTYKMQAQPYLGPAFEEFKEPILNTAADAFVEACEAISV